MLLIKLNKFHWIRKTLSNKAAKSNNNNEIDAVFLLRTGESLDIKTDYFNKSLKPLLSRHRIVKSLKSLSWLCSKRWSEIADGLHSTLFPVKCDILMSSLGFTLRGPLVLR